MITDKNDIESNSKRIAKALEREGSNPSNIDVFLTGKIDIECSESLIKDVVGKKKKYISRINRFLSGMSVTDIYRWSAFDSILVFQVEFND